jgi:hypothetical protein
MFGCDAARAAAASATSVAIRKTRRVCLMADCTARSRISRLES